MPSNRKRPRQKPVMARPRWQWRRAAGGWAEFLRNLALLFFGAPFVEPLLSGAPVAAANAIYGTLIALALFVLATILDIERRD